MTKRPSVLLAAILTLYAVGSVRASDWMEGPAAETRLNNTVPVTGPSASAFKTVGTNLLSGATRWSARFTNEFPIGEFSLSLADWPKQGDPADANSVKTVGVFQLPDGTRFTGDMTDGDANGWGVLTQPNGTRLEGEWRNGIPYHLSGIVVVSDGTVENGTWDYVEGTGRGTISWRDGRVYKGPWNNIPEASELPEGYGTMTWPDGRTYVGPFHKGQMHGQGKITYPNGKVVEGLWARGDFILTRKQ